MYNDLPLDAMPNSLSRETLGCWPRECYVVQKTQASRGVVIFVACLALFEYMPLVWHSEISNLT
jgi:hypothetical protein